MSYSAPIDISSFTETYLKQERSTCVFALDIGGSLAKLAYQTTFQYNIYVPAEVKVPNSKSSAQTFHPFELYDYQEHEHLGHRLCFVKFETTYLEACLNFIRDEIIQSVVNSKENNVALVGKVTGGGAFKYKNLIQSKLRIRIEKEDEMECLVRGCTFLLKNIPDELFIYDKLATPAHIFLSSCLVDTYPFLLVNIGSGVSFLKIESKSQFSRVGGTSIGGGTFWGIGTFLSGGQQSFDELLSLADEGDHRCVDMLVRDIYGGAYESLGLPGDVIASSFGLAARRPQDTRRPADLVKSLLVAISNNIGQLAFMYAKLHDIRNILFGGFFIRGHPLTMRVITHAVKFWSNGEMKAMFLRHEGYLGAVGAFIKSRACCSCAENYSSSSTLGISLLNRVQTYSELSCLSPQPPSSRTHRLSLGELALADRFIETKTGSPQLYPKKQHGTPLATGLSGVSELSGGTRFSLMYNSDDAQDRPLSEFQLNSVHGLMEWTGFELEVLHETKLEIFPLLLSPTDYLPDTWDITQDVSARAYWLACFKRSSELCRRKALESQQGSKPDALLRSNQFAARYVGFLNELADCPSGRGILTVRCILEAQQHFLREFHFPDAYCHQKRFENTWAFGEFSERISKLRTMEWSERQLALICGIMAGNVFDWGASEAIHFFMHSADSDKNMANFDEALKKIQPRPWLMDDFDRWMYRIRTPEKRPHCVLIFCDNCGADLILGLFPFVIECLGWGSMVILTANSGPAINDVTYPELLIMINQAANLESSLSDALASKRLICVENGQTSPCLDLRRTSSNLVNLVKSLPVDLIVIVGMGRAVHTNLYARFRVDCLKMAVIKNSWLACRLGGDLFSVMFRYEEYASDIDPSRFLI